MKNKTFKTIVLFLLLIPVFLGAILLIDNYKITGKVSLITGKQTCITDPSEFITDPPSECQPGEEKFYFRENGCIIEVGCYTPPSC